MNLSVLLFTLAVLSRAALATHQAALRAELELSTVCYATYEPELWNGVVSALPETILDDVDRFAAVMTQLREQLRSSVPVCTAVARVLLPTGANSSIGEQCRSRWFSAAQKGSQRFLPADPFWSCLQQAHLIYKMGKSRTPEHENARAANARYFASTNSAQYTTYSGTYKSALVQQVADAIKNDPRLKSSRRK